MIYECFIQKLGNPRISESAESRTNSFSIESVFKLQICDVIELNFRKANNNIFVARIAIYLCLAIYSHRESINVHAQVQFFLRKTLVLSIFI